MRMQRAAETVKTAKKKKAEYSRRKERLFAEIRAFLFRLYEAVREYRHETDDTGYKRHAP